MLGAVSNGSLRHAVQTLPLWFPIVPVFRGQRLNRWAALPFFGIWLAALAGTAALRISFILTHCHALMLRIK